MKRNISEHCAKTHLFPCVKYVSGLRLKTYSMYVNANAFSPQGGWKKHARGTKQFASQRSIPLWQRSKCCVYFVTFLNAT